MEVPKEKEDIVMKEINTVFEAVMALTRSMRRGPHFHDRGEKPRDREERGRVDRMEKAATRGMAHSGFAQMRLLSLIEKEDGATSGTFAELLDIRPSSLSEKLNKLEERGLIERHKSETDTRSVNVFITEEGRNFLKERKDAFANRQERFENILSEEEKSEFLRLVRKLIEAGEA